MFPFQAVYSQLPPKVSSYYGTTPVAKDKELQDGELMLKLLEIKSCPCSEPNEAKMDVLYKVGAWMYLKLQSYRRSSLFSRARKKMARKCSGPYKISEKIGVVAYKLDPPCTSKIHPIFHLSLLKTMCGLTRSVSS